MILSGLCMCYTVISAHNFFHRRDNFRMFYFNLSFFNYKVQCSTSIYHFSTTLTLFLIIPFFNKEWRISHAMSHHLFPNSVHDMEVALFEPILCWIPSKAKTLGQRFVSWIYSPIIYPFITLDQLVKRIIFSFTTKTNLFQSNDLVPLAIPLAMLIFGNSNPFTVLKVWLQIILANSFIFHLIGLNAGHHSPDLLHDGDKLRFIFRKKYSYIIKSDISLTSRHIKSDYIFIFNLQRGFGLGHLLDGYNNGQYRFKKT